MRGKGFTLIELMIVVAIIAILALIAVPLYQRYVERSRESAVQSLLQQVLLAETARLTSAEEHDYALVTGQDTAADLEAIQRLMSFGFRPDPRVGFVVVPLGGPGGASVGIIAYAAYKSIGARLFVYDNVLREGVQVLSDKTTAADFPEAYNHELLLFLTKDEETAAAGGRLRTAGNRVTAIQP